MEGLIDHNQVLEEARFLLSLLAETTQDISHRSLSISETPTEARVNISVAEKTIVSVVATICNLSIDWENFDRNQSMRNNDRLEAPITIERKTEYVIGNISLLCYEAATATLSGKRNDISNIIESIGRIGNIPKQLNVTDLYFLITPINPQKVRFKTKYACLIIDSTIIDFSRAYQQSRLLRVMFGGRGKSRSKVEFEQIYEVWAEEENQPLSWDAFGKLDDGKERAEFITKIRNTVRAINNNIRKVIGMTEDFLEAKNNACYINPKLLKFEN